MTPNWRHSRANTISLSFAKTASAPMSLCCNAFITVMKATHLRNCDNSPGARHLPRKGTLLVEPQMGSGPMVVTEIRSQSSLQMLGVQDEIGRASCRERV